MSMPLSTSTTTNDYIDSINSEFNFQLAEMTVFKFPDSDQCKCYLRVEAIHFQKPFKCDSRPVNHGNYHRLKAKKIISTKIHQESSGLQSFHIKH